MKDMVILGAGGFAREVAFLIDDINRAPSGPAWNLLGYIDTIADSTGVLRGKYPILGDETWMERLQHETGAVVAIGNPRIIRDVHERCRRHPLIRFPNLIHPSVIMDAGRIILGEGNILCAGNIFTTDITIGSCNIFNLNSTFGHDLRVGSGCVFNPGLNVSGGVVVGDGCLIGTGATILQNLRIGAGATVGAGAVVTRPVEPGATVVGVPARPRGEPSSP